MTGLNIREATEADRDAIREVTLAAYQEYAATLQENWKRYQENILATLADFAPADQLVAEQDGALAGTVLLYPSGAQVTPPGRDPITLPAPEIRLLAVAPAARGQGIGAALMRECLRRARQGGATTVTLHTTDMMRVAQSMYVRMGFQRAAELDFEPAPGIVIKGYRYDLNIRTETR